MSKYIKKYLDPKKGIMFWISVAAFAIVILIVLSRKFTINIPVLTPLAEKALA